MADRFAAIILAGGQSRRMGEFKPLLSLGGATLLEHGISLFRKAGIRDLRVVTGHEGERLDPLLEALKVPRVANPRYQEGMFTSIQAGVTALQEDVTAFFLLPVDIPLVRPQTVKILLRTWYNSRQGILQPVFFGTYGHPPLISTRYRQTILTAGGEGGLKKLLRTYSEDTLELEISDEHILLDMDTPEDYRILCHRWNRQGIPSEKECEHLLAHEFALPLRTVVHCRQVAGVATLLADELLKTGRNIDRDLVQAAALLHDCARKEPRHAQAGEKALRLLGFPEVASVVGRHMDLKEPDTDDLTTAALVYLADKLVEGDRRVSLEERFQEKRRRYAGQPDVLEKIEFRLQMARKIQHGLETVIGRALEKVLNNSEHPDRNISRHI
jgi:CTP:molybdopterin cytidylyltransferase MocA